MPFQVAPKLVARREITLEKGIPKDIIDKDMFV